MNGLQRMHRWHRILPVGARSQLMAASRLNAWSPKPATAFPLFTLYRFTGIFWSISWYFWYISWSFLLFFQMLNFKTQRISMSRTDLFQSPGSCETVEDAPRMSRRRPSPVAWEQHLAHFVVEPSWVNDFFRGNQAVGIQHHEHHELCCIFVGFQCLKLFVKCNHFKSGIKFENRQEDDSP